MEYSVKRIGSQTVVYGIGIVAVRVLSFLMLPVYLRLLSEEDYGVVALVSITFDVLSLIAGSRLATGIFRFYHKSETERQRSAVIGTSFILIAGMYVVVGVLAFAGAELLGSVATGGLTGYGPVMRAAALSFVVQSVHYAPIAFLRLRDEAKYVVAAEVGKFLLQLLLNVYFLAVLDLGVASVFYSSAIATTIIAAPLVMYLVRHAGLHFSMEAARDLYRFGFPMMVNQMATLFVTFADRIVLVRVTDVAEVGVYNVAFTFAVLTLAVGGTPFLTVWDPVRHELARSPTRDRDLSRGFRHLNLPVLFVGVGLALFTGPVLQVVAPENTRFAEAAALMPMLVAAHVLLAWGITQDLGILVSERTGFVALANWIAAGVSLLGFIFLIPPFGSTGAAFTCLLSFATRYVFLYGFSQRLWPIRYEWGPVLRVVAWATLVVLADQIITINNWATSVGVKVLLLGLFVGGAWRSGILSSEERRTVSDAIHRPRLFLELFQKPPANSTL